MMSFSVIVIAVVFLTCSSADVGTSSNECPEPTSPENGNYTWSSMTVNYTCNSRYSLVGNASAYCHNGNWSSATPQCWQDNVTTTSATEAVHSNNNQSSQAVESSSRTVTNPEVSETTLATEVPVASQTTNAATSTYYELRNPRRLILLLLVCCLSLRAWLQNA